MFVTPFLPIILTFSIFKAAEYQPESTPDIESSSNVSIAGLTKMIEVDNKQISRLEYLKDFVEILSNFIIHEMLILPGILKKSSFIYDLFNDKIKIMSTLGRVGVSFSQLIQNKISSTYKCHVQLYEINKTKKWSYDLSERANSYFYKNSDGFSEDELRSFMGLQHDLFTNKLYKDSVDRLFDSYCSYDYANVCLYYNGQRLSKFIPPVDSLDYWVRQISQVTKQILSLESALKKYIDEIFTIYGTLKLQGNDIQAVRSKVNQSFNVFIKYIKELRLFNRRQYIIEFVGILLNANKCFLPFWYSTLACNLFRNKLNKENREQISDMKNMTLYNTNMLSVYQKYFAEAELVFDVFFYIFGVKKYELAEINEKVRRLIDVIGKVSTDNEWKTFLTFFINMPTDDWRKIESYYGLRSEYLAYIDQ